MKWHGEEDALTLLQLAYYGDGEEDSGLNKYFIGLDSEEAKLNRDNFNIGKPPDAHWESLVPHPVPPVPEGLTYYVPAEEESYDFS